uniref:PIH1D1/2/3 CS-like domain-containing protein n=1 Tax=Polytomella parva TaxID=51329 RepID=A0A7S0YCU0_9CHLO|mmetsp:Transcript_17851/g.32594  ORF Transcript_17851/g.32594 Transcript_17851/m.32594 type:complete len:185 (+) Transcript_17851:142-696(+)|eukprot:CAMPEP_0175044488 /NCGR_PEP_ID=MMETSP0052_2-20121109/3840_1 /TAXON_ID=51329 ORGANISM="Polytomella parva, Strain SAG 63-3" /NCGR_SAMPLE_ID=MMETSP0052_2 /ASSEMBLY_ACC=CAM_ASM_000194 /LENGTH=184 /DNA_ID=CAMNT_0016307803 /DNA_START=74 /DNA_END=628 /DNA_ORIENTATION=+
MSLGSFARDYETLSNLLSNNEEDLVDTSNVSKPSYNPGVIGPRDLLNVKIAAPKIRDPNLIWDDDELIEAIDIDVDDGREVASYEISYKQNVETTDMFLGMSGKDPSSTCCEILIVNISLPGLTTAKDIVLDVQDTHLKLDHFKYKLSLYFPHKVFNEKGKAKFMNSSSSLKLELPINREDDPF